jgi:putative hydrolase of the HAD superfamily
MLFSVDAPTVPAPVADALAVRHAPVLCIDRNEPAPPLALGYAIIRAPQVSPSSKFVLTPPSGGSVIEYAIWHDWDIQHLYDLEHVWVHLDAAEEVVRVEGTMHGLRVSADTGSGLPVLRDGRPVLYCEPGKHAIWADARAMQVVAGAMIREVCGPRAGAEGIHLGNRFAEAGAFAATPRERRLARLAMRRAAFVPAFAFRPAPEPALMPWATLAAWIPARMTTLIAALPDRVPHLEAVFFDCGDTLIDEATEVKIPGTEIVTEGAEIPHAMEAVHALHACGHRLALVADGPSESFENLLRPRGIWELMDAHVISGEVGALKPSPRMFAAAMQALRLTDPSRVVMVGNNLSRDIKGANDFGHISLFVGWSNRRSHIPADASERPDHSIDRLDHLVARIDEIELALEQPHV